MARIRTIKPEFWTSEQIVECSPTARLLFIGMWNFFDDGGNHPASLKTLKLKVFPGDDFDLLQIESMVQELIRNGLLLQYQVHGRTYWHVTGWKHQKIEKPSYKFPRPVGDHSANGRRPAGEQSSNNPEVLADDLPADVSSSEGNVTEHSPLPPSQEGGVEKPAEQEETQNQDAWSRILVELKSDCASTSVATNLEYDYDKFFRDSWQVGKTCDGLLLEGECPDALCRGLERYRRRLTDIGKRLFGVDLKFEVLSQTRAGMVHSG